MALVTLIGSLLLAPGLVLSAFFQPPAGVAWWAAHALLGCALAGSLAFEFDDGQNPRLAAELPRVWLLAIGAGALLTVLAPEQVVGLWFESDEEFAVVQLLAAVLLAGTGFPIARLALDHLRPRRGGRRRPAGPGASGSYVARLTNAVVHRAALLARYAGLGALSLLTWLALAIWTGGAFLEGWIALLLAWFLMVETSVVRWSRETLADGFVEGDAEAGRLLYEHWWGLSAGWVLSFTASVTARMGGVRPEPVVVYLALFAAAWLVAAQAWARVRRDPDAVLAAWLRRRPQRLAELLAVAEGWPPSRRAEFGVLPDLGGYDGPKTGERPRGR